jgi:hypothetical protein
MERVWVELVSPFSIFLAMIEGSCAYSAGLLLPRVESVSHFSSDALTILRRHVLNHFPAASPQAAPEGGRSHAFVRWNSGPTTKPCPCR